MSALFTELSVHIEKTAFDTKLGQDATEWPATIFGEAHKKLPFLGDYKVTVRLERADGARGAGVGQLDVKPKTGNPDDKSIINIPVLIRDFMLAPLDVFIHKGRTYPVSEHTLQELFQNPSTFRTPTKPVSDASGSTQPDFAKLSSVAIDDHRSELINAVRADESLMAMGRAVGTFGDAIIHWTTPKTANISEPVEPEAPSVLQFQALGSGFVLKMASAESYTGTHVEAKSRAEVQSMLPDHVYERLQDAGHITLVPDPIEKVEAPRAPSPIKTAGWYEVSTGSETLRGYAMPDVVDFDGVLQGITLFAGDSVHGVQEKVAGLHADGGDIPHADAGVVTFHHPSGWTTEPVKLAGVIGGPNGIGSFVGTRLLDGSPITVTPVDGLLKVARLSDSEVAIPGSCEPVALRGAQVPLATPFDAARAHQVKLAAEVPRLLGGGDTFMVRGVDGLPDDDMDEQDTEFTLGLLGFHPSTSRNMMKAANMSGEVFLHGARPVARPDRPGIQKVAGADDVAALRKLLINEAAVLSTGHEKLAADPETLDAVLSLGFITPENVSTYLDYIPSFEKAASQLAEILVASRLGMDQVKEAAARNAMVHMSSVLRGLKRLRAALQ
jgi:hypothetical protein